MIGDDLSWCSPLYEELASIVWQGACAIDASNGRAPAIARRSAQFIAESLDCVRRAR